MCLNLLGQNDNPTFLAGEATMDQASLVQYIGTFCNTIAGYTIINARIVLCYHFGVVLSLTSLVAGRIYVSQPGHLLLPICQFYFGLAFIELYPRVEQRSYKEKARKVIKQMQKWIKSGCINKKPLLAILDAEMETSVHSRNVKKIDAAFDEAVLMEARTYGIIIWRLWQTNSQLDTCNTMQETREKPNHL
jgi:hypothetical protein